MYETWGLEMTYPGATSTPREVTTGLRPPWISSKFCVLLQPAGSRNSYPQVSSAHPGGVSLGIKHLARHDSEAGFRQPSRWVGYQVDCEFVGRLPPGRPHIAELFPVSSSLPLGPVCRQPACHAVACRTAVRPRPKGGQICALLARSIPASSPLSCSSGSGMQARTQARRPVQRR